MQRQHLLFLFVWQRTLIFFTHWSWNLCLRITHAAQTLFTNDVTVCISCWWIYSDFQIARITEYFTKMISITNINLDRSCQQDALSGHDRRGEERSEWRAVTRGVEPCPQRGGIALRNRKRRGEELRNKSSPVRGVVESFSWAERCGETTVRDPVKFYFWITKAQKFILQTGSGND